MTVLDRARERLRLLRDRSPAVDHAVRAQQRHREVLGNQIAGAITYFGFLSLFPLLALGFSAVGYLSAWFPEVQPSIERAIDDAFPSIFGSGEGQINVADIASARAGAGVIGVLGLLYAGLGWVDALRDGLRRVFGTSHKRLSFVRKKLVDVFVLLLLGLALLASVAVSTLATDATTYALDQVGLDNSLLATAVLKVLATVLALSVDTVIVAILFSRLPGAALTWREVRSGALLAAVGFEVLKLLGTFLIGKVTNNPLYATFGVVVGLLVWINMVSRLFVYAAAWTATLPAEVAAAPDYDSVPVGVDGVGSSRRTLTVRGVLLGAAVGAGLAGILTRRGARD